MAIFLIIVSILLWGVSVLLLMSKRQMLAPVSSYLALFLISLAKNSSGVQLLPINYVILIGWLVMTLIVMSATMMQSPALQVQTRGTGYLTVGAIAGMAVGLIGYTFTASESLLYSIMILATLVGTFFGFLLFTNTPKGIDVNISSGRFFKYLLAKGFPVAITVMMMGVAALLAIAINR